MITVHELSKTYKDQTVLNMPHLDIPKGQRLWPCWKQWGRENYFFQFIIRPHSAQHRAYRFSWSGGEYLGRLEAFYGGFY